MRQSTDPAANARAITEAILDHWHRRAPEDRLAHLVRHASRGFRRSLELRLSEHGISFGQWSFLRILWREDGLSQRELSLRAGVMAPTTHTAIHRMEEQGLVELRRDKGKGRARAYLSARGRGLETRLVPLAEEANAVAVTGMSADDAEMLRRLLLQMVENLARDEIAALERGLRITSTRDFGAPID